MQQPEEWAKSLHDEIREEQETQALSNQALIVKQGLINAHASDVFDEIARAFQNHCNEYNKVEPKPALVFTKTGAHSFLVRRDAGFSELILEYKPQTKSIHIYADNCSLDDTYRLTVASDGETVILVKQHHGIPVHPSKIAQSAIRTFIKAREPLVYV